jgi:hypothetical protein
MAADTSGQLELRRGPHVGSYWLHGQLLCTGDPLEVLTTLGWMRGVFSWQGESYLPCVEPHGKHKAEVFVILSSSICRRPQVDLGLDLKTPVELIHRLR